MYPTAVLDEPGAPPVEPGELDAPGGAPARRGVSRLWRGKPDDPWWVRPALLVLLAGTAGLYLWDLGASGWGNAFYSGAVQAGTKSWKAFFFGSSDASNFITVDKPPASLWVMELSARMFGVNSWSILVPQALEGVATVGVVYATVRRWFTPGAALLSGAVVALTPVAALMFRYNNPDALLTLLLALAAYATVRALERAGTWWLVLAASLVGFGFITKMLQAFTVVPVLALVYLLAAPTRFWRRLGQLVLAGLALVVSAGWWVAAVQLTPAADRPYVGGSADNNLLNLIFGYNGFGRLTGNETGSVGGTGAVGSRWGPTGWFRLFETDMGGQISWLIPAALIGLVAVLWFTRRAPRTDRTRAAVLLFGGWLLVTGAVFSLAEGIIHPYYTVALAPAIGALVGISATFLWHRRAELVARLFLAAGVAASGIWAYVLLDRSPTWMPLLRTVVLVGGIVAAVAIAVWPAARKSGRIVAVAGVGVLLAGPLFYTLDTVSTPHAGAIPSAGPAVTSGVRFGFVPGGPGGFRSPFFTPGRGVTGRSPGFGGPPPGAFGGGGAPNGGALPRFGRGGFGGFPGNAGGGTFPGGGGPGGGFLNASTPGKQLVALLEAGASKYRWAAATINSNSAAGYQLASGQPIMAIGGFNGTDPAPTLAQFETDVAHGEIHYYIASGFGGFGAGGGGADASQIASWVAEHFSSRTVDGVTIYDLTSPTTGAATSVPLG
ncbi:MAG TPA: glycosyltransferase family 39 protein [Acidimicrobiales bacterium]|nr:glycosyltransferase family 39 protein [Acidimicrobiales bacterium]